LPPGERGIKVAKAAKVASFFTQKRATLTGN
jgi:hypothetical protein